MSEFLIAHLKKLDVKPGDTLVLELPDNYYWVGSSRDHFGSLKKCLCDLLGFDVRLIVTSPGAKLSLYTRPHFPSNGWEVSLDGKNWIAVGPIVTPPGAKLEKLPEITMMDAEVERIREKFMEIYAGPRQSPKPLKFSAWQPKTEVKLTADDEEFLARVPPLTLKVKCEYVPDPVMTEWRDRIGQVIGEAMERMMMSDPVRVDSDVAALAESANCPQGHHTRNGPCRRDYCLCRCPRCEAQCTEGGQ